MGKSMIMHTEDIYARPITYKPDKTHMAATAGCPCDSCPRSIGCTDECRTFRDWVQVGPKAIASK